MDLDRLLILLDEIDDHSQREKKLLKSSLERLVENIFKLQYWEMEKGRDFHHWQMTIFDSRNAIQLLLQKSPNLRKYLELIYPQLYRDAIDYWQAEFYIPPNVPIELELILQKNYYG